MKKLRRIDMYIMREYGSYCDEALRYNDLQFTFKVWKDKNIKDLVKGYVNQRRLTRDGGL
tara:strand:+ start:599 stop:778 length:180 start_codon:yes stop_codon:yes gene_type:complete